jgi:hypothetical protein
MFFEGSRTGLEIEWMQLATSRLSSYCDVRRPKVDAVLLAETCITT